LVRFYGLPTEDMKMLRDDIIKKITDE